MIAFANKKSKVLRSTGGMIPPTSAWNLPTFGSSSFPLLSQDSSGFSPAACAEGARKYETYVHTICMVFGLNFLFWSAKLSSVFTALHRCYRVGSGVRDLAFFLNPKYLVIFC